MRPARSTSATWRPASSERRSPPSTKSRMMAVSRRETKSCPAQVASSRRRSSTERTGVARRGGADPLGGVPGRLALLDQEAAEAPDPTEPGAGGGAGRALAPVDEPAADVVTAEVGGPDVALARLVEPGGQARDRLPVASDGRVAVPVGAQGEFPARAEERELGVRHGWLATLSR